MPPFLRPWKTGREPGVPLPASTRSKDTPGSRTTEISAAQSAVLAEFGFGLAWFSFFVWLDGSVIRWCRGEVKPPTWLIVYEICSTASQAEGNCTYTRTHTQPHNHTTLSCSLDSIGVLVLFFCAQKLLLFCSTADAKASLEHLKKV